MKIIQIADLHIGETIDNAQKIVDNLIASACSYILDDDFVAVCICGDVIDKGQCGNIDAKYTNALKIFNIIINALEKKKCHYKILIIPGNHDIDINKKFLCKKIESFNKFCNFAESVTSDTRYREFLSDSVINIEFGGINWVLCNSAYHRDISYGKVELEKVKTIITNSSIPSIIMTHHTMLSADNEDSSSLRNAYELINTAEKENVFAILHGHVHGYKRFSTGKKFQVIGVGPLLKQVDDVNKQINVIELSSQGVCRVTNLLYRNDMCEELSVMREEYVYVDRTTYYESDLKKLICQVQNDAQYASKSAEEYMHNVIIRYRASFETFCKQITTNGFLEDSLEKAKMWQNEKCPDQLYFNHGSVIFDAQSMKYVIDTLTSNPTSRRALISLIDQNAVQNSKDDYLPSFNIVQFSFPDDYRTKLNVSLYMRSLEASKFLPINICELYLMILELKKKHLVAKNVDIAIFAHCVSYIEGFDGFEKSRLDILTSDELQNIIASSDYQELYSLIDEKSKKCETVLRKNGVDLLLKCIHNSDNSSLKKELNTPLCNLGRAIDQTSKRRKDNSSLYDSRTKNKESELDSLNKAYSNVLNALNKLKKQKSRG